RSFGGLFYETPVAKIISVSLALPNDGLAAFRAFLKSEFCEENIEFWLACEDFKKTKSPQKLTSKAKKIYNDFIEKEAPKEINIDFQTKNMIAQNIHEVTHTCFSAAQKRVYSLMENNSYPRFLESEFYQELSCEQYPDPKGWGTEHCLPWCKSKY
uniref:Regulator of G-protein signaling 2 n=1 Tax=Zosterops lateralis melanops TaxID=1220523 RepID=A0A8D2PZR6_ZOSLA